MNSDKSVFTKPLFSLMLAAAMGFTLAGCGGGGGGGGGGFSSMEVTVTPADGSIDVATDTTLSATFAKDIFADSFGSTSFTLSDGNSVTGTASFDALSNSASFTPDNELGLLTTYTATLDGSITDLSGNPIGSRNWNFTTRDGVWGSATTLSDTVPDAIKPYISSDDEGNMVAVWISDQGVTSSTIWASYYSAADAAWGSPELLSMEGGAAYNLHTSIDGNGNVWAVWQLGAGLTSHINTRRYNAATATWEAVATIDTGGGSLPKIAADAAGNAMAIWYDYGDGRVVYVNHYVAGSGWESEQSFGSGSYPHIAMDDSGNALAVWFDWTTNALMSNYYSVEADAWDGEVAVSSEVTEWKESPSAVFDGDGTATVVWYQYSNTDPWPTSIYANRYTPGSGWGTETLLVTDTAFYYGCELVVDGAGNLFVIYQSEDFDDHHTEIRVSRYDAATGWGTPETLYNDAAATHKAQYPSIVVDDHGHALAFWAWQQTSTSTGGVYASRYQAGSGWGAAQALENTGGYVYGTSMAVHSNGAATVVWAQYDGASGTKNVLVSEFR